MRWVEQEHAHGCALATLAMLTGHSYDQVRETVDSWDAEPQDWETEGTSHHALDRYLAIEGFYYQRRYQAWFPKGDTRWFAPFAETHYAAVKQPSNNSHFVAMDADGIVRDPLTEGRFHLTDWPAVFQVVGLTRLP